MKSTKIIALLLVLVMCFSMLASCKKKCKDHVDANDDLKCDKCGADFDDGKETEEMFIESENIAVDTTKKQSVDKSRYPSTGEKTTHQHAVRDEYIVGLDEVTDNTSYESAVTDDTDLVLGKTGNETPQQQEKASDDYEARLDEIDRLIISIQGGDSDKK